MGRKTTINTLPLELRDELKNRLLEGGFCGYLELEEWLRDLGYSISKSAIHRFAQNIEGSPNQELRLRCAEIAANFSTADTIIANAKTILRWVNPPRS